MNSSPHTASLPPIVPDRRHKGGAETSACYSCNQQVQLRWLVTTRPWRWPSWNGPEALYEDTDDNKKLPDDARAAAGEREPAMTTTPAELGPLVNDSGAEVVVLAMPREAYDLIVETLERDSRSSAFDRELRERVREALDSVIEMTDAVHAGLNGLAEAMARIRAPLNLAPGGKA
jgi:hypothetical protein